MSEDKNKFALKPAEEDALTVVSGGNKPIIPRMPVKNPIRLAYGVPMPRPMMKYGAPPPKKPEPTPEPTPSPLTPPTSPSESTPPTE